MVLLVRNEIFMFAFLNKFVIKVVSLAMYAKVAHLCVGGCVCVAAVCSLDVSGCVPVVGGVCGCGLGRHCSVGCSVWWRFLYYNHLLVGCKCLICCIGIV